MALHRNQKCFQIYSESGYQLERVPGQDIFDMFYENKLVFYICYTRKKIRYIDLSILDHIAGCRKLKNLPNGYVL